MTTLLFIDDKPNYALEDLKDTLSSKGYAVDPTIPTSQDEGIRKIDQILETLPPQELVVLVDHNCPDLENGTAIMEHAVKKGVSVVLAMSGTQGPAPDGLLPKGVVDAYGIFDASALDFEIKSNLPQRD